MSHDVRRPDPQHGDRPYWRDKAGSWAASRRKHKHELRFKGIRRARRLEREILATGIEPEPYRHRHQGAWEAL